MKGILSRVDVGVPFLRMIKYCILLERQYIVLVWFLDD